jgi:hypothetical protein
MDVALQADKLINEMKEYITDISVIYQAKI